MHDRRWIRIECNACSGCGCLFVRSGRNGTERMERWLEIKTNKQNIVVCLVLVVCCFPAAARVSHSHLSFILHPSISRHASIRCQKRRRPWLPAAAWHTDNTSPMSHLIAAHASVTPSPVLTIPHKAHNAGCVAHIHRNATRHR